MWKSDGCHAFIWLVDDPALGDHWEVLREHSLDSGVLASGLFLAVVSVGVAAGLTDTLGLVLVTASAVTVLVAGGSFLAVYWRQGGSRAGRRRR